MTAKIIDGKKIADNLQQKIALKIKERLAKGLRAPGLSVIILGENPASKIYVNKKRKISEELGIISKDYNFFNLVLPTSIGIITLLLVGIYLSYFPYIKRTQIEIYENGLLRPLNVA